MRWRIVTVGKPKFAFVREGVEMYLQRLRRWTQVELVSVRAGRTADESRELARLSEGYYRVLLDERGELLGSLEFAARLQRWQMQGPGKVALLIGGAAGHDGELRRRADWVWSLSPLTLQHEIALLVAMEQVYRAYTIAQGTGYHRE